MARSELKTFLWYCTKLNFFMILIVFVVLLLSDQVYNIHKYFYGGTLEDFKKDLYLIIGFYKIIWLFFNVIPYGVLWHMEKKSL